MHLSLMKWENLNITKFFIGLERKKQEWKGIPYNELRDLGFCLRAALMSLVTMDKWIFTFLSLYVQNDV